MSEVRITPAQKGCGAAFFVGMLVVGLGLLVALGGFVMDAVKSNFWAKAPCTIVGSERISPGPEGIATDGFLIRYRYSADGREYTSHRFTTGLKETLTSRKIDILLSRYPKGAVAHCYINPRNPSESVLQRGSPLAGLIILFPLVFIGVGVGGIIAMRRPASGAMAPATRSWLSKTGAPLLFFGLFALVGGVMFYFLTFRPLRLFLEARKWPATPCEIVSSSVGSHTSSGKNSSTTYSIDIVYRYVVAGREYLSDRYEIFPASSSGRARKAAVVKRYPAGSRAECYVNPEDPAEALLNRKLGPFMLIGLLPGLFLLIGLGGLLGMARSALAASRSASLGPALPPPPQPDLTGMGQNGRVQLASTLSPKAKFITALIVAVFWNGIMSFFVKDAIESWAQPSRDVPFVLFIGFMTVLGLGLLGLAGMMFLNLFNPRVALAMSPRQVVLGAPLDVEWELRGPVSRVNRLFIVLEGREEITTGTGKQRRTRREVFSRLPITETADPHQIRAGRAQIVVPAKLKPTSDTGNRKVVWELQARGEIPNYPDMSEDFEVTVRSNVV